MKIRSDFVTNSSSSSFILCFDSEKDWEKFSEHCLEFNYEEILDLMNCIDENAKWDLCGYKSKEDFILSMLDSADKYNELLYMTYDEAQSRIKSAYKVIAGEIWDSDGGILEWAIRNKFLSSEFSQYCIVDWQIG